MPTRHSFLEQEPTAWQKKANGWTREFYGKWHLSPTPAHKLTEDLVSVHGCRHDLHVLLPLCVTTDEAYRYFSDDRWYSMYEDGYDYDEETGKFRQPPTAADGLHDETRFVRPGFVHFPARDQVQVQLGAFVPKPLDEEQVAECLYALQHKTTEWHGTHVSKDFYGSCVFPHVMDYETDDPFTWAYERARIANGYAMSMEGKDAPPIWMEEPYTKVARHACRKPREALRKTYAVNEASNAVLAVLHARLAESPVLPEACFLALEHPHVFTIAAVENEDTVTFFRSLETMLKHGLDMENVSRCLRKAEEHGVAPRDALRFACTLTRNVYGGDKAPWWFREDQGLDDWEPSTMEEALTVSRTAGFAYREVRAAVREHGGSLSLEGVHEQAAVEFLTEVVQDYGIGNAKRLANVVRETVKNLERTPVEKRMSALLLLRKHLHDHRPASAIIGRMEGEDGHFHLPGITSLVAGLASDKMITSLNIGTEHVERLRDTLAKPPLARLEIHPVLSIQNQTTRLLIPNVIPPAALLTAPETPAEQTGPLTQLVEFYERLREECGSLDTETANVYFTFCATRFPNPFSPPPGFLKFVHRYCELPDPNYRWLMMEHPRDRERISGKNQVNTIRRFQRLSHLLDAWVSGLASWEDVWDVCRWMTEEPAPQAREEKRAELVAREREYERQRVARRQEMIVEHRLEHTTNIAKLLQESIRTSDTDAKESVEWKLQRLVTKRDELPKEVREDDEHRRAWEAEGHKEESLEQRVDMELRIQQNEVNQARVLTVASGIHALEKLHCLVSTNMLSPESLRDTVPALFAHWKSGATAEVEQPSLHEETHRRELEHLQTVFGSTAVPPDVLCQEGLLAHLRSLPIHEALPLLFADLQRVQRLFEETRRIVTRTIEQICTHGSGDGARMLVYLDAQVERLWEQEKLLRPEGMAHVRESYAWVYRHVRLQKLVCSTTERADAGNDFSVVNAISHKTVAALVALAHLDSEEALPRLTNDEDEQIRTALIAKDLAPEMAQAEGSVLEWRKQSLGLCPVGAKIHVLHAIDQAKFDALVNVFGYERSGFYLLHANTCLIIPPMPSSQELAMIIGLLAKEGVIDLDHPEIQICLPGRLPPQDCAVLGSTMLLTTDCGVRYQEEAFCTSHDHLTGARMLAYDAGATPLDLPFMTSLPGRTDILGRRSLRDLPDYQLVGTVLAQDRAGRGPFAHLAGEFRKKQRDILAKHGLDGVLSATWIAVSRDAAGDDALNKEHYRKAVKPCVEAYFASAENGEPQAQTGVIHELRQLLDWLRGEVSTIQKSLPADPRYKRECEKVLQLSPSSHV